MMIKDSHLIWIDMEMTGLDVDRDHILEIATVITNSDLEIIAEGPAIAIHQSDAILKGMDEWNTQHHHSSGLAERVKNSRYTVQGAEIETLHFLKSYVPARKSPMCGNSICQDRRFLHRWMPTLEEYFHYRHLDVSTLKILAQRWAPTIAENLKKESRHLALDDIRDSINELRYYRKHFLKGEYS